VFLRVVDDKLRLGIYYAPSVIAALEQHNPQQSLSDENLMPLLVFLEEIDHAVHATLKFRDGHRDVYSESFVRDLELQAKVDTYLMLQRFCAAFNENGTLTAADRRWLRAGVFDSACFAYAEPLIAERYLETNRDARRYARYLDKLTPERRTREIRRFRTLGYAAKRRRIDAVCGAPAR
jgi:hypothetical protein